MENERAHLSGHGSGRYLQNPNPEMSKRAQGLPERYPAPKNKRGRHFVDDITHGHAGLFMVRNSVTGEGRQPLPQPDGLIMLRPLEEHLPVQALLVGLGVFKLPCPVTSVFT